MQPSKDSRPWVCCGANQGDALSVFAVNIHQLPVDAALASLRSAPSGLASAEAARRLDHFGPNQIERAIRLRDSCPSSGSSPTSLPSSCGSRHCSRWWPKSPRRARGRCDHQTHQQAADDDARIGQEIVSASADEDVHIALGEMRNARVRRLPVRDAQGRLTGMLLIEDVVVRGLEGDGVNPGELIAALRAMYVRTPAAVSAVPVNGFPPG